MIASGKGLRPSVGIMDSRPRNGGVAQFPGVDLHRASNTSMKRNFLAGGWRGRAGAVLMIAVAVGMLLRFFG